jgi:hypothetical protein
VLTEAFDPINMPDPGQYEEDTIFGMKVWESSTDPRPAVYFARGYTLLRYDGQNVESLSTYPGHIRSMEVFDADGPGPGGETIHFFVPGMGTLCSIPPVLGKLYSYDPVTGEETWVNFPYTCKQVVFCSPRRLHMRRARGRLPAAAGFARQQRGAASFLLRSVLRGRANG